MTSVHQKMTLGDVHTLLSASCHRRMQRSRPLDGQRPNLLMSLDFSDLGFELPELLVFLLEITQTPESQPVIQIPQRYKSPMRMTEAVTALDRLCFNVGMSHL